MFKEAAVSKRHMRLFGAKLTTGKAASFSLWQWFRSANDTTLHLACGTGAHAAGRHFISSTRNGSGALHPKTNTDTGRGVRSDLPPQINAILWPVFARLLYVVSFLLGTPLTSLDARNQPLDG